MFRGGQIVSQINRFAATTSIFAAVLSSSWGGVATAQEADQEDAYVLDVITVEGYREGLARARELERGADSLVNIVSGDSIGKLPDTNVAEALNRLTGVYLRPDQGEGRYVSIRGVDPILNNVTLNGQTIGVSDTDGRSGRAAPLDVLSASSLNRVEVFKVTTPDLDGQSIGGTINIVTPTAFDFDGLYATLNGDYGFNDFGDESDIYSLDGAIANTFLDGKLGVYVSASYWYKEYLSHLYENPRAGFADEGVDALYPNRVRFGSSVGERERTNATLNLEYRADDATRVWAQYYYTEYLDTEVRPEFTIRNRGDLVGVSETEFFWTRYALENETRVEEQERPVRQFVIGGEKEIGAWTLEGNLNYTTAEEVNPFLNYYESETRSPRVDTLDPALAPVRFELSGDGRAVPFYNADTTGGLTPADPAFHNISRRRAITSNVEEETYTADFDALWEGEFNNRAATFKTGFKYLSRDKSVDDQDTRFPFEGEATLADSNLGVLFSDAGQGIAFDLIPGLVLPIPDRNGYEAYFAANRDQFSFDESSSASNSIEDDYTLEERIAAAYVMASIDLTDTVNLIGGVRIEQTDVDVSAFSFVDTLEQGNAIPDGRSRIDELPFGESDIVDVSASYDYTTVLPSIILRWDPNESWQARASISTNLGRPDYPDVAPISTLEVVELFDDINDVVLLSASNEIGNPELDPYYGINYDASLTYYLPDNTGAVSVGAFYKNIDNAIYSFRRDLEDFEFLGVTFDDYSEVTLNNAEDGHIAGIELSFQKDFVQLPAPFDGFGVLANASFIDSEVEVFERPGEKLPFFNQADTIYNAQLYYEKYGFQARVAYAYQSEAIFDEIGSSVEQDIFRAEYETVNARLSYNLTPAFQISLTGSNLTDEPDLTYRNGNEFFIAENPGLEKYGREFRIGFNWKN